MGIEEAVTIVVRGPGRLYTKIPRLLDEVEMDRIHSRKNREM